MTNVPAAAITLIKRFEGFEAEAYPDPLSGGAPYTIGWGNTTKLDGTPVRRGDKITLEGADALLTHSLQRIYLPAISKIPYFSEMSPEQVGALLSFSYNLGPNFYGNPDFTTITRHLASKDWDKIPTALTLYVNPGSNVEAGLRRRRVAEGALWSSGLQKFRNSQLLITANRNTILKKEPLQSFELTPQQRVEVPHGRSYTVVSSEDDGVHTRVVLSHGAGTWYIYDPHWTISVPGKVETSNALRILLNVPYYTQLDSATNHAVRMCFSSSCAMAAEFLKPGILGGNRGADDLYMTKYVFRHGDTTNPVAQTRALADLGIVGLFRKNLTRQIVIEQLRKGVPVPVGYLHKGPLARPSGGGHWAVIVGVDIERSEYIVNDPWGECDLVHGRFLGSQNGYRVRYPFRQFEPRWMVEGDGTGWGIMLVKP